MLRALITVGLPCTVMQLVYTQLNSFQYQTKTTDLYHSQSRLSHHLVPTVNSTSAWCKHWWAVKSQVWPCRHTAPYSLLANGLLMCRFAAPLAFNFMAAVAIPPSSRHSEGDYDVQDTVSSVGICESHVCHLCCQACDETLLSACSCSRMLFCCASAVCINSWNGAAQLGHTAVHRPDPP